MPTIPAFVDSNVLLYAVSTNPSEVEKRRVAREILAAGQFGFSTQVAQEFFVNATRKLKPPLSSDDALKFLQKLSPAQIVDLDFVLFQEAVKIHGRFQISYWDAAIVAAAKRLGSTILYSEDLNDGQNFDGVQVVNPFRAGFIVSSK
ncbi:MAG TPA: PIN domain-containing protein [Verrucomicrobiae bacterium]|nr:PIN domain-containing protein [Verrucomicrobiae bacterium]